MNGRLRDRPGAQERLDHRDAVTGHMTVDEAVVSNRCRVAPVASDDRMVAVALDIDRLRHG